jgi:hypothetical protein
MTTPREDQVTLLLGQFPGSQTLRRSLSKWLRLLAIGIVFVALGIVLIGTPETFSNGWLANRFGTLFISLGLARETPEAVTEIGWVAVVFFGIGCFISIITLLPGAAGLTLDKEGFVVRSLFRRRSYQWLDVGEFEVVEVKYGFGSQKVVGFNDHLAAGSTMAAANLKLTGRNSALSDTYGLSVEDLARLMSLWRERALSIPK